METERDWRKQSIIYDTELEVISQFESVCGTLIKNLRSVEMETVWSTTLSSTEADNDIDEQPVDAVRK